ncbi:MAG: outer membrane protein transport protein [Pseudomonadota bacterium]
MRILGTSLAAGLLLTTAATGAFASGFNTEGVNPGGALFNDKRFVIQGGFGYVNPMRKYSNTTGTDQLGGAATGSTSTDAADSFILYNADLKVGFTDNVDCAGRVHQPWRLTNNTAADWAGRFEQSSFNIDSRGLDLTCSYKMMINDTMRVRMLGGLRSTTLEATRKNAVVGTALVPRGLPVSLAGNEFVNTYDFRSEDRELGYRIGASFEIPSILLRAQVIYDSAIEMNMVGTQDISGIVPVSNTPVTTSFDLPQSISMRVQSGVSQTTLVWVGAKWQEWSTIPGLTILNGDGSLNNELETGWNDAWTVEVGAARRITKDLNAQASITWNQGIGGGYTDTWTFGAGVAYDLDDNWRVSVGGAATLLTASSEDGDGGGGGASSNAYNQGDDWALSVGMRLQYALD